MEKLTPKQAMFCKEYLVDLNATQAAIRSNYSKKTAGRIGQQNLQKVDIQAEIQKMMDKRSNKVEISADYVLKNIKEIGERCMQEEPVLDFEGNKTGEYQFKENGALKAQELLGKHLKMFVEQKETKITGEIVHKVSTIDLDERVQRPETTC